MNSKKVRIDANWVLVFQILGSSYQASVAIEWRIKPNECVWFQLRSDAAVEKMYCFSNFGTEKKPQGIK